VVAPTMDPLAWLRKHLEQADADLLRELVATIEGISKSQVSELAKGLDAEVAAFRSRPLDGGPMRMCGWTRSASVAGRLAAS
jgi:hypothetical protein